MEGDEAFYYLHRAGRLIGAVIIHVDDFTLVGTQECIDEVLEAIEKKLTVSKIKKGKFRYIGIDVGELKMG